VPAPPAPDALVANRENAIALLERGGTLRSVARQLEISHSTIKRWADEVGGVAAIHARVAASRATPAPAAAPVVAPAPAVGDGLSKLREVRDMYLELAANAHRAGDYTLEARALRDAGKAANDVARIEASLSGEDDDIVIHRADLERAQESLAERLRTLADRPIVCARCSRELVREAAEGKEGRRGDDFDTRSETRTAARRSRRRARRVTSLSWRA
jgi:transposase-like protein